MSTDFKGPAGMTVSPEGRQCYSSALFVFKEAEAGRGDSVYVQQTYFTECTSLPWGVYYRPTEGYGDKAASTSQRQGEANIQKGATYM